MPARRCCWWRCRSRRSAPHSARVCPDHPLYARLADELKLPLHANGWAMVLGDETLRADQIHANAAGYRAFAEGLAATLRNTGLLKS